MFVVYYWSIVPYALFLAENGNVLKRALISEHLRGIESSLNMYDKLQVERIMAFAPPHGKFLWTELKSKMPAGLPTVSQSTINFQILFLFDTFEFSHLDKVHWWYIVIYFVAFIPTFFFLEFPILHCPWDISLKGTEMKTMLYTSSNRSETPGRFIFYFISLLELFTSTIKYRRFNKKRNIEIWRIVVWIRRKWNCGPNLILNGRHCFVSFFQVVQVQFSMIIRHIFIHHLKYHSLAYQNMAGYSNSLSLKFRPN